MATYTEVERRPYLDGFVLVLQDDRPSRRIRYRAERQSHRGAPRVSRLFYLECDARDWIDRDSVQSFTIGGKVAAQ